MTTSEVINLAVAISGLVLSMVAIVISIKTFQKQIILELFYRRYDIYYACELICGMCSVGMPKEVIRVLELRNIECDDPVLGKVKFLFDDTTYKRIMNIFGNWNLMRNYYDYVDLDEKIRMEYESLKNWFESEKEKIDKLFENYLDLRETK